MATERPHSLWQSIQRPRLPRRLARGTLSHPRLRMLVVEPDPSLRRMIAVTVRGVDVVCADSTDEATELLELMPFDAIVSNSVELLAHVDVFLPHIHRVLLGADVDLDLPTLSAQGIVERVVSKGNPWKLQEMCAALTPRSPR